MRPTSIFMVIGLVLVGGIIADFVTHPAGTKSVANGVVAVTTPAYQAVTGQKVT